MPEPMASRLKTVLVTGAEGALGRVVVSRFAREGIRVEALHRADPPSGLGQVNWTRVDLSDLREVQKTLAACRERGSIDGFVHCAGGFRYGALEKLSGEDLEFLIDANLRSTVHLLRELVPSMRQAGFGRIVLVGARAVGPGRQAPAGMGMYAATKSATHSLVEAIAQETLGTDVTINAVLPSVIDTPANRRDMPGSDPARWVSPEALAEIIYSLTQPWGDPIHGALIPVSGRV
jgi:NAD(P)-dependent dehydrogenase (short-subunit alcohol dehydrogenase family)